VPPLPEPLPDIDPLDEPALPDDPPVPDDPPAPDEPDPLEDPLDAPLPLEPPPSPDCAEDAVCEPPPQPANRRTSIGTQDGAWLRMIGHFTLDTGGTRTRTAADTAAVSRGRPFPQLVSPRLAARHQGIAPMGAEFDASSQEPIDYPGATLSVFGGYSRDDLFRISSSAAKGRDLQSLRSGGPLGKLSSLCGWRAGNESRLVTFFRPAQRPRLQVTASA
jgi:hypothetical protein